ncbi:hypothetical protein [Limnochorda pilosa]|uniref:hypothetical protein n=1 Tax=Limnochorda pilosa TaxID=1555112 RepID=UPI0011876D21|nr:hypothetical protein [Limnochorda pilosa]
MAVIPTWLQEGLPLLGGALRLLEPGLVEVTLPPEGLAELEEIVLSPFVPSPPSPPRVWALDDEGARRHPEAEWVAPGSARFRQWVELGRRRAPAAVARWLDGDPTWVPVLELLWRVESNGSGRLAWTLASRALLPGGPVDVRVPEEEPPWLDWLRTGRLGAGSPPGAPRPRLREAVEATLRALANRLAPEAAGWAREQRTRWEAERRQVAAYHQALLREDPDGDGPAALERHLEELERSLAPRLRARPLLALLLYLPPGVARGLVRPEAGTIGSRDGSSSSERAAQSGQARAGTARPGAALSEGPAGMALPHAAQVGRPHAAQDPAAHRGQKAVPHAQGDAQPGQRSLGQRQRSRRSTSRPHS